MVKVGKTISWTGAVFCGIAALFKANSHLSSRDLDRNYNGMGAPYGDTPLTTQDKQEALMILLKVGAWAIPFVITGIATGKWANNIDEQYQKEVQKAQNDPTLKEALNLYSTKIQALLKENQENFTDEDKKLLSRLHENEQWYRAHGNLKNMPSPVDFASVNKHVFGGTNNAKP